MTDQEHNQDKGREPEEERGEPDPFGFRAADRSFERPPAANEPPADDTPVHEGLAREVPAQQPPAHELPAASRQDDWFWWTDGTGHRPVSDIPVRPDLPRYAPPPARTTPNAPWSPTPVWTGPAHVQQPRRNRAGAIVAGILAAAVLIASGIGIGWGISQPDHSGSGAFGNPPVVTGPGANPNDNGNGGTAGNGDNGSTGGGAFQSNDPQQVAQHVLPAIVVIRTRIGSGAPGSFDEGAAAGTGMILTSDGEILTNNHVIRGSTAIQVTTSNGADYDAQVVGADPGDDVALLQLEDASGLTTIASDTSNLTNGLSVVAIGNANGTGEPSATAGTVTALDQDITAGDPGSPSERLHGLIQTNAPIAPGDSGGALVDTQGEVIGMITAATQTSSFSRTSTQGYAITIGDALGIVQRIRAGDTNNGDIIYGRPGLLGVQVRNLTASVAARLGLSTDSGAYVIQVVPGTPAANAGMPDGSVITNINGTTISSAADVSDVMHSTKPGDTADITWTDTTGSHSASVQLITAPAV